MKIPLGMVMREEKLVVMWEENFVAMLVANNTICSMHDYRLWVDGDWFIDYREKLAGIMND